MRTPALIAVLVVAACGKGDGAPTGDGPVGEVVRVQGAVSATRGHEAAAPRALAVADAVFANDTVTTGDDSAVDIRLKHNDALWKLGANAVRRVDASAAWRAKKGGASEGAFGQTGDDRTAAAGRHAEREAAARGAEEGMDSEPDRAVAKQDEAPRERSHDDRSSAGGRGGGSPGFDDIGLGEFGTVGKGGGGGSGSGYGSGSGSLGGGAPGGSAKARLSAIETDGPISKEIVRRVMRRRRASFKRCYEHELKKDDSFVANVDITFTIDTSGRLSPVTVSDVPAGNNTFEHCLKAAVRAVQMPTQDAETSVRFRLIFSR
jgi:hypothetical protein